MGSSKPVKFDGFTKQYILPFTEYGKMVVYKGAV